MLNQQLLAYIKQQLQQGQTQLQISSSLSANGWPMQIINETFNSLNPQVPGRNDNFTSKSKAPKIILIIVLIFLGLFIGAGCFAYFFYWQSPEMIIKRTFANLSAVKTLEYSGEIKAVSISGQQRTYTLNLQGKSDVRDSKLAKSSISILASIGISEVPMVFGIDMISIGQVLFFQLNKAENFTFLDLSSVESQWVKFDPVELTKQFGLQNFDNQIKQVQNTDQLTPDQTKRLQLAFSEAKIYRISKVLPGEKLEGRDTYHYQLAFDREGIKSLINEISTIIRNKTLTESELKTFDDGSAIIDQLQAEVWIGKKDLLPYKLSTNIAIIATEKNPSSGNITMNFLFKNWNSNVVIEAPNEYKTIEEIFALIFNNSMPTQTSPDTLIQDPDLAMPDIYIDSDNDGLNDQAEAIYGTDPLNQDSDGDTYKDGDEVKNGYNPLGPGKIPTLN